MEQAVTNEIGPGSQRFHERLLTLMDDYVHLIYSVTKTLPKEELYGVTSQLRRSALSVVLNYVEGYARCRDRVYKNFLETSYGSLKESRYLVNFSLKEGYLNQADHDKSVALADEIGAMLWSVIQAVGKRT